MKVNQYIKKSILTTLVIIFVCAPFSVGFNGDYNNILLTPSIAEAQEFNPPALSGQLQGVKSVGSLLESVALLPIFISSFFVYVTGYLLNLSILETVIRFGSHFGDAVSIASTWGALRDLSNIFFIFGLLAIAISTILGLQSYGYKQLLARLIIVALFINFSLFFTKVAIDTSNLFALQFYKGISVSSDDGKDGIANTFMRHLGVTSLWETDTVLRTLQSINSSESGGVGVMFLYSILASTFFMITAFVFAFAAIMLITRGAMFILLAILSPLAFAAMVLPKTRGLANQWWTKLGQYAMFAPILLMLFWVVATVIPDITKEFAPNSTGLLNVMDPNPQARLDGISMVLNFMVLIALMLASIIISNKLSLAGAQGMSNFGKKMAGGTFGKTFGLTGALGRSTIGRGLSKLSQNEGLKDAAAEGGLKGIGARLALKTTQAGAKANYDLRSAPGVAGVAKAAKVNLGKAQKGGYEAVLKKQLEDREKFSKSLAPSATVQAGKKKPLEDEQKAEAAKKKGAEASKSSAENEVKNLNTRKQTLIREGKEYSPESDALDAELNAAEEKVARAERLVREIEQKENALKSDLKKIDSVGKQRTEKFSETLASEKTFSTLFTKIPRKNKEAALKIKKGKSEEDKLVEGLTNKLKGNKELKDALKPEEKEE